MHQVRVKKEVILCAGVLRTPAILEYSGIGNAALLEKLGIEPLVDLPGVGENLQEHIYTSLSFGKPWTTFIFLGFEPESHSELKDDVDFDTPDLLREADNVAKHLKLQ